MTDLLAASKKAFRTLRQHQADISYILPLQVLVQLRKAIAEEEQRRARLEDPTSELYRILFDPNRIKSAKQAAEIANEITALIAPYLQHDKTETPTDNDPTNNAT